MAHWLVKSEPFKYSFEQLQRDGKTVWDGVRNNTAALYLRAMKLGDEVLFYHSNEGLAVVGIAKVVTEHFIDPTDPKGRYVAVELAPVRAVKTPVTLAPAKAGGLTVKIWTGTRLGASQPQDQARKAVH